MRFIIETSKIVVETWEIEADNDTEAIKNLLIKAKKLSDRVVEFSIDNVSPLEGDQDV